MSSSSDQPDKQPVAADLSGRQVGDFRLLRRLGHGAMADVYLAEQQLLRRRVAVKILKPELAGDRTYLKRFEREAQAAAGLMHANIVQVYEVGDVGDLHYIVQEYVEGENLRQWIGRHGPPDLPRALSIIRQVAAALAKAAEKGVVHRDIKPENIMLTRSGEVKVADFGLARVTREGEKTDLTQVGMTMGTPLYMSPEQVEGKPLDARSDLYSFGVTCYHMLSGAPPFSGDTALGVAVQHLKKQPEPLEVVRPDLPAALSGIVHRLLAKEPDRRYASARDVLHELRQVYHEASIDDWPDDLPGWESTLLEPPAKPRSALAQRLADLMNAAATPQPRRRDRLLFSAGLLIALVLGGLTAWFVTAEPPLLADADTAEPTVPRRETALQQYLLASQMGTEAAWESVVGRFPEEQYFVRRAKQQLARIYLQGSQHDRAMEIFEEFAALDPAEEELRAFGLAGKCGVLSLQGRHAESVDVMAEIWPLWTKLTDREMRMLLRFAAEKNRQKLGAATTGRVWDARLREEFGEED